MGISVIGTMATTRSERYGYSMYSVYNERLQFRTHIYKWVWKTSDAIGRAITWKEKNVCTAQTEKLLQPYTSSFLFLNSNRMYVLAGNQVQMIHKWYKHGLRFCSRYILQCLTKTIYKYDVWKTRDFAWKNEGFYGQILGCSVRSCQL